MGGLIAVTIKQEDGTVHNMERWTNPLPYFLKDLRILEEDEEYIQEYINQEHEGKWEYTAPMGYGLVVLDLQSKAIFDCNGYSSFNHWSFSQIYLDSVSIRNHYGSITGPDKPDQTVAFDDVEYQGPCWKLKKWIEAGRIKAYDSVYEPEAKLLCENPTVEEIIKLVQQRDAHSWGGFMIDWSPFDYFKWSDGPEESWSEMREQMVESGWKFTDDDLKEWDQFVDERYSEE